jgi:hypothetical protein
MHDPQLIYPPYPYDEPMYCRGWGVGVDNKSVL